MKRLKLSVNCLLSHDNLHNIFSYIFVYKLLNIKRCCKRWRPFVNKEIDRRIDKNEQKIVNIFTKGTSDSFIRSISKPLKLNKSGNVKKFTRIITIMEIYCERCQCMINWSNPFKKLSKYTFHCCGKSFLYCCSEQRNDYLLSEKTASQKCFDGEVYVCGSCKVHKCNCCSNSFCKKHIKACLMCNENYCKDNYYNCIECKKRQKICINCIKNNFVRDCWKCENIWFDEEMLISQLKEDCLVYDVYLTELQKNVDYDISEV